MNRVIWAVKQRWLIFSMTTFVCLSLFLYDDLFVFEIIALFLFVFFIVRYIAHRLLVHRTPLILFNNEAEILSDYAAFCIEDRTLNGRLIITNLRITFIVDDGGKSQYDFFIHVGYPAFRLHSEFTKRSVLRLESPKISVRIQNARIWIILIDKLMKSKKEAQE